MHVADIMIKAMAMYIADGDIFLHGLSSPLPALAMHLAKKTHAPNMVYLCVAEGLDPDPSKYKLCYCSADPRHSLGCIGIIELAEAFDLAAKGKLTGMFLGGAQIDKWGNINLTCIGDYYSPKVKLPGGAATAYLTPIIKKLIIWTTRHSKRVFVEKVDFKTGIGYQEGKNVIIVTDKAVFHVTKEGLELKYVHPNVEISDVIDNMSFKPIIREYKITPVPSDEELKIIRSLDPDNIRFSEFK